MGSSKIRNGMKGLVEKAEPSYAQQIHVRILKTFWTKTLFFVQYYLLFVW